MTRRRPQAAPFPPAPNTRTACIAVICAVVALFSFSPVAQAGSWIVDLGQCPDYLEDTLDRLEGRVERRDERRTYCPSSALIFDSTGPGNEKSWDKPDGVVLFRRRGRFFRFTDDGAVVPVRALEPTTLDLERYDDLSRIHRAQERAGVRRVFRGDDGLNDRR